jgi:hypothetical protein
MNAMIPSDAKEILKSGNEIVYMSTDRKLCYFKKEQETKEITGNDLLAWMLKHGTTDLGKDYNSIFRKQE